MMKMPAAVGNQLLGGGALLGGPIKFIFKLVVLRLGKRAGCRNLINFKNKN